MGGTSAAAHCPCLYSQLRMQVFEAAIVHAKPRPRVCNAPRPTPRCPAPAPQATPPRQRASCAPAARATWPAASCSWGGCRSAWSSATQCLRLTAATARRCTAGVGAGGQGRGAGSAAGTAACGGCCVGPGLSMACAEGCSVCPLAALPAELAAAAALSCERLGSAPCLLLPICRWAEAYTWVEPCCCTPAHPAGARRTQG